MNPPLPPLAADETTVGVGSTVELVWNGQRQRLTITGESRSHWSVPWFRKSLKIPKARRPEREHPGYRDLYQGTGGSVQVFLTEKALADYSYLQAYRHRIAEAVGASVDADVLRQVAALLGMPA